MKCYLKWKLEIGLQMDMVEFKDDFQRKLSSLHCYRSDEKGRHLGRVGYGLFGW